MIDNTKLPYDAPAIEVVFFEVEEVICQSPSLPGHGDSDNQG
jgi:hypothetical protein